MDTNKFTYSSQESIAKSIDSARTAKNPQVLPLHLFLPLLKDPSGVVYEILAKLEVNRDGLLSELQDQVKSLPQITIVSEPPASREFIDVLNRAGRLAQDLGDQFISREHLLLALLDDTQIKPLAQKYNFAINNVQAVLNSVRGGQKVQDKNPEGKYGALDVLASMIINNEVEKGSNLVVDVKEGKVVISPKK